MDDDDEPGSRKLAPIYNALDSGNYRSALKLATAKNLQHWDIVKARMLRLRWLLCR